MVLSGMVARVDIGIVYRGGGARREEWVGLGRLSNWVNKLLKIQQESLAQCCREVLGFQPIESITSCKEVNLCATLFEWLHLGPLFFCPR
jgi:hypothetical protein